MQGGDYASAVKELVDVLLADLLRQGARWGDVLPIDPAMYADEPPWLPHPVQRTHFAGFAEHLADLSGGRPPEWCLRPEFTLLEAVYLGGPTSRERLVADTPKAFAKRRLYTGSALLKLSAVLSAR